MIPESAGLDRECPGVPLPKVAAVISWFGVGDMEKLMQQDLLPGRNDGIAWFGSMPDRAEVARARLADPLCPQRRARRSS